ncbi:hypothetical protein SprV_0301172100 [Sparganum proliferum]
MPMRRSTNQLANGVDEATSRRRRHGVPSNHRPRSPQYPVHAAQRTQGVTALTWFSPPVEAVARGVAAEQSPATWSHSAGERVCASGWVLLFKDHLE